MAEGVFLAENNSRINSGWYRGDDLLLYTKYRDL